MSWQAQPNQDDVRYRSGKYGWDDILINSLPKYVSKSATGNGSVNTTGYATNLAPGQTNGDTAKLYGWFGFAMNVDPHINVVEIGYYLNATANPTNDIQLGWKDGSISSSQGVYYDITNGQYVVNGDVASASTPTGKYGSSLLRIEVDNDRTVTTFSQRGHINDETTINTVPGARGDFGKGLALTKSNGGNGDVRTTYARQEIVF